MEFRTGSGEKSLWEEEEEKNGLRSCQNPKRKLLNLRLRSQRQFDLQKKLVQSSAKVKSCPREEATTLFIGDFEIKLDHSPRPGIILKPSTDDSPTHHSREMVKNRDHSGNLSDQERSDDLRQCERSLLGPHFKFKFKF